MFDKCFGYVLFLVFRYRQTKPMYEANDSSVSEFVFLGLSASRPVQHFLLAFSTVFYVTIVLGNLLVVFAVTFDPHLHSPMYFL